MLFFLLLMLLLYLAGLFLAARLSLHPPRIPIFSSPGAFGAPQENIAFSPAADIECFGWWVAAERPRAVAVLAHGYAMNRSELAPQAFQLCRVGVSCLLFDFRAHGRSRGGYSTIGWREREEIAAAAAFARERHPDLPIILIGSSMGSAASAFAVGEDPGVADGLVLDSSYSKLSNAVPGWWRFVGGVPLQILLAPVLPIASWMARMNPGKVDVALALGRAGDLPVLVIHGDKDDLAPPAEAERNLAALNDSAKMVWCLGCGHTEGRWLLPDLYWTSVSAFIDDVVRNFRRSPTPPLRSESEKE